MTQSSLSSQEMGERFDLLATDAKEYAVFLVGLDGHLLCWNAGAERIFGYQSHEIMGQHFSRFFSPEDILTGQPEHELDDGVGRRSGRQQLLAGSQGWHTVLVSGHRDAAVRREETGSVIRPSDARPHRKRGGASPAEAGGRSGRSQSEQGRIHGLAFP